MADISLKYLTELTAATETSDEDLLHISQGGNDRSLTLSILIKELVDNIYPPGITIFFNSALNPNDLFPGTTWSRLTGAGRTIRLANETGGDVGQTGGNDEISLSVNNIPEHSHEFSGTTNLFDHGTKQTNQAGSHHHDSGWGEAYNARYGWYDGTSNNIGSSDTDWDNGKYNTSTDGEHTHNIVIGSHQHGFSGTTEKTGSGVKFSIVNSYIKQAAWYRVA